MIWLELARSGAEAAANARRSHPRSAVSRAYFAIYAAAHSLLLNRGEHPPQRGNWPHAGLGDHLQEVLARGGSHRRAQVAVYRKDFGNSHSLRVAADYGPERTVGPVEAAEAVRIAGRFVRLAEKDSE